MTLADALARRGVRFRQSGDKVSVCCPFCPSRGRPPDTRFRLCFHARDGWCRCLHCGFSRRSSAWALSRLGVDDPVAGAASAPEPDAPSLPSDFALLADAEDELDVAARDYILGRGVTPGQLRRWGVGVSYEGRWAYRVVFPVRVGGELRCVNARDFTGRREPKYLLSRGPKWLACHDPDAERVVLSEGVIKALRIGSATGLCSAAMLGHDLTDAQLGQIIGSRCRTVTLYPDLDPAGRRGFAAAADKLRERWGGEVRAAWPVDRAADDADDTYLRRAVEDAAPWSPLVRGRMLLGR